MLSHFSGNIFGGVLHGQVFVIAGKTIDGAVELNVNLQSGKYADANVLLQLKVLFKQDIIVRNSRLNGMWGCNERQQNLALYTTSNPLLAGDQFKFYIYFGDGRFHIAVNDASYCTYDYRLPIDDIRTICIDGDVQSVCQIDHRSVFPAPLPIIQADGGRFEFSNDVPRKLYAGHVIVLTGIPSGNPKGWFDISFTEGASKKQALHFNPRFQPHYAVVRNAMNDDMSWPFDLEERHGGFPFAINVQFKLAIALTETEFKFAINGMTFPSFTYRHKNVLKQLNGLKLIGSYGMHVEVTGLDHVGMTSEDCQGFEQFSLPYTEIM